MYKGLIRSTKLVMIMTFLFVILTGFAMIAYPGGSKFDRISEQFNFFRNFLSDLGATVTSSGKQNVVSNILYITALGGLGLVLIYFSRIWRAIDIDVHKFKFIGILSKIALVLAGFGFMGIALTPWNKYYDTHIIFVKITFISLFIWTFLIIILQLRNHKMKELVLINIVFFLYLGYFLYLLYFETGLLTEENIEFKCLIEKILFYFSAFNFFVQARGINHFLKSSDFRKKGMKNFYV